MQSGNLNFLEPSEHLGPVMGLIYPFFTVPLKHNTRKLGNAESAMKLDEWNGTTQHLRNRTRDDWKSSFWLTKELTSQPTPWRALLEELVFPQPVKKFLPIEGNPSALPCSEDPVTYPCPEADWLNPGHDWPRYPLISILLLLYVCLLSHPFLPGTTHEPAVNPTAHASSFTLQYFPYYVWCSKYSCLL